MPGRRRLLIVDDEEALQRLARRHAERADFDVLVAGTVAEALKLAVSGAPSAILLDLSLPDGSGIDVLWRLKSDPRTAEIPVVVWSGVTSSRQEIERPRRARWPTSRRTKFGRY